MTVRALRDCPRCGSTGPFTPGPGRYLQDLVTCGACTLVFSNLAVPDTPATWIEYLDRFHKICPPGESQWVGPWRFESYRLRRELTREYAWAVPSPEALARLAELGPLVEIGAGGGYWAMLLRDRGVDVVAFDTEPHENEWVSRGWSPVEAGGPEALTGISGRALFLCWPPYDDDMARRSLMNFQGDTVAYIGEDEHGCTADASFFRMLHRRYRQQDEVMLPQWPGVHDTLTIWGKRQGGKR